MNDTDRLNWLIAHGYTPAKWRSWRPGDPPSGNGMTLIGLGGREEIDEVMDKERKPAAVGQKIPLTDLDGPAFGRCSKCGRQSWSLSELGKRCGTPMPNGETCDGFMFGASAE